MPNLLDYISNILTVSNLKSHSTLFLLEKLQIEKYYLDINLHYLVASLSKIYEIHISNH